jgi:glutathione synthase/RimK-type ligase-like ATP-grasp enzyme
MRVRLLSTSLGSQSLKKLAIALQAQLGSKVWRSKTPKPNTLGLKYGNGKNKIEQYQFFKDQGIPALPFTLSIAEAKEWVQGGSAVVCRKLTNSCEGKGIVVAETPEAVCSAPVYTKYLPKKKEFRVHVFKGHVVTVLEKRRKKGVDADTKIRNTANGYVFCREDVVVPEGLHDLAIKAAKVSSSDFQGVDIGFNVKKNQLFVIEVNSGPGMEGTTVQEYANTIVGYVKNA